MKYETLEKLKSLGIESFSNSNMVYPPTKIIDGNSITEGEALVEPTLDELLAQFNEYEIYTVIDPKNRFYRASTSAEIGLFSESNESLKEAIGLLLIKVKTYL